MNIAQEWLALRVALQFLSCLPVTVREEITPALWARSLLWYPAVGLIIGLLLWLACALLPEQLPALLGAALLVALWVGLTGALHLDGWADCVDAWVGGIGDRERTLAIMKDPRCGPMAVVALVCLLLLKVSALMALLLVGAGYWWLIPLLARTLILPAFLQLPYVRSEGLGSALAEHLPRRAAVISLLLSLALLFLLLPFMVWLSWLLAAGLLFVGWRQVVMARLQGFTGDCVGALVAVAEVALLVVTALGVYQ
ncbi:adenosylcobinamide-GDP ribazoletransferase [Porticoccus sp. W117]|uniref:adenosylcobinamide-GDP ribazoletransferase n=1 Tax=Porticoccus sp. W117 TaxID=3054777 RepID=UPI0025935608|nr:adenosylcobinamide-GDP ribazoletransferase [Porticoccus sp. W117]MDM3871413.1 adenosylcobinamide-GDP ribazoletransferase [Porticoccus sp. W117]